jgi:hypothetical protein
MEKKNRGMTKVETQLELLEKLKKNIENSPKIEHKFEDLIKFLKNNDKLFRGINNNTLYINDNFFKSGRGDLKTLILEGEDESGPFSNIQYDIIKKEFKLETWEESYHNSSSFNEKYWTKKSDKYLQNILKNMLYQKSIEVITEIDKKEQEEEKKRLEKERLEKKLFTSISNLNIKNEESFDLK